MPLEALIVDDEPLARKRLRKLLAEVADVALVGESQNGRDAVAAIRRFRPDLVFLDVQMPEMDGFAVLKALDAEQVPAVIFVTAYDQYAIRAFEVNALDYLLKPFDRARFRAALDRARREIALEQSGDLGRRLLALAKNFRAEGPAYRLVVKSAGRIHFIRSEEIDWIEAAGNYLRLHVAKERHLLRQTLGGVEAKLDPGQFLRIHRSTIVNVDRIREIVPGFNGEYAVMLGDGTRLTLSRGYRERVLGEVRRRS